MSEYIPEQVERRRRNTRKFGSQVKKQGNSTRAPGELDFKKELAIILKIAGYSHMQIANSLNETKRNINNWMGDPQVREKFQALSLALAESASTLLESYTIEAVQQLVVIMRTTDDPKFQLDAIREILDRGGLPKTARAESHVDSTKTTKTQFGTDESWEALRHASPEVQEKAAQLVEGLEHLLVEVSSGPS